MLTTLVIGATGHVGRPLVDELVARGVRVRALVRTPASAGLPGEVEPVPGDLTDLATVSAALVDVDAVFLVWPFTTSSGAGPLVELIARHARRIVYLSSMGELDSAGRPRGSVGFHGEVEALIESSGLSWTFLRPSGFAVNTTFWAPAVREGVVRLPYGAAARPLIDERDIASVGVAALVDAGHAGKAYALSGPAALTQAEQVATIASVVGRPVRFVELTPEEGRALFRAAWGDSPYVDGAIAALARFVTQPEPVTTAVPDVLGRPARTFRSWVEAYRATFAAG